VRRREFLTLIGGAAAAPMLAPLAVRAQQSLKMPTIGFLGPGTSSGQAQWVGPFVNRLRELGWIEGRTVKIEYRWGEGRAERVPELVAEFVRLKVDVILAAGTEAALAAQRATSAIPIVFPLAADPVGSGLVASLSRPGGNITGVSNLASVLAGKRLELLREILPEFKQLAIMANAGSPNAALEIREIEAAARTLAVETVPLVIRRAEDIAPAFDTLKGHAQALYVVGDPLMNTFRRRINTFALAARIPTMGGQREYVEAAGLMSYGAYYPDLNRRAAEYVDKILRGSKPADLPVEQPTKFEFVINLATAKALGLEVPPTLLALADEVIE
jgi:putative ABC transport system substrate-binding protein